MSERSKEVVRGYFEELDRVRGLPVAWVTDDFVFRVAGMEPKDRETSETFAREFFATIPDLQHPLDEVIAEGDTVAFRCRYEGTHTLEVMGAAPTGNKIDYTGIGFMRVRDGKVAEFYVSPDAVTFMRQLGLLPAA
jgi:predicted ester cyclase